MNEKYQVVTLYQELMCSIRTRCSQSLFLSHQYSWIVIFLDETSQDDYC